MTGRGAGAISTVEIFGDSAQTVIRKIFKPAGASATIFKTGRILLGTITDGAEVIDQVTIGCEGPENFAIHCHGNPLIVEMIMELLRKHGASLVTAEQLLAETLTAKGQFNTIAIEAKLAQARAKTIDGTKLIANQVDGGLTETAQSWLDSMEEVSLDKIKAEADDILQNSQTAGLIIYGCIAVLTGPPNSGKSTLLNYLAGRQKAIVTDIRGTTRDWVEAECRIGSLSVTMIDTAGVDENLHEYRQTDCRVGFSPPFDNGGASPTLRAAGVNEEMEESYNTIEQDASKRTAELLKRADLILLVLDLSQPTLELNSGLLESISGKRIIIILNKSDLPARLNINCLPKSTSEPVRISAKEGTGMEDLMEEIRQKSGTANFNLKQPICFTHRQEELLGQLTQTESKQQAVSIITGLQRGRIVGQL